MITKDIPKKLCLFWEGTPPLIRDLQTSYSKIKNWDEVKLTGKTNNNSEEEALKKHKQLSELMQCGFYVFHKLAEKDPKIFDSVSPAFHAASACHLFEFKDNDLGQNVG